jgi:hypothetical protein
MTLPLGLKSGLWPKGGHLPTQIFALPMQFAIGFIGIGGFFHRRWGGAIAGPQRWNHATTGNPDALIRCEAIQTNQSSMALIDHVQIGINYFLIFSSSKFQPRLRLSACPHNCALIRKPQQLRNGLKHHMGMAGSPNLMTLEMIDLLCEQRNGNFRTLMVSANRLLDCAMRKELKHIFQARFQIAGMGHALPIKRRRNREDYSISGNAKGAIKP